MPEGFTDQQLREAASEAGISPVELRQALAERSGGALMSAPARGVVLQAAIALAAPGALATVRRNIETLAGHTGHGQGEGRFDIVDDNQGLTYRINAGDAGNGLALVRIEVDTSAGRGALALAGAGVGGIALTVACIGWLFSVTTVWLAGLGIGVLGALFVARGALALAGARRRGEALAAQALGEAQTAASTDADGIAD